MALEPNEANLGALAGVLLNTLSGNNQLMKEAAGQLTSLEARPQYSLCLLQLISMPATDLTVKLAASITFKNFVLLAWAYEDSPAQEKGLPDVISQADRAAIKTNLIRLMVAQPKNIQAQLGQALAIISSHDFPHNWPSLLPELVGRFETCDAQPAELLGILEVMHSIFYRYRTELKSERLWQEIKVVLDAVCDPLSKLFLTWVARLSDPAHSSNPTTLPIIIGILALIVDNFLSLNSQDIAGQFEEPSTLKLWFNNGLELLKYSHALLEPRSADAEDPTTLDSLKATICDIINLFCWKYEDQFAEFVPNYVTTIWDLLTTLSGARRFDHLVNSAMKFLTSVVKKTQFKGLFDNEAALSAICEKVIIPQLRLRDTDLEVFEDNAQEYIRIDIEGSDVDTRRRTSVDFIHGLTMHFEAQISTILKNYVQRLIAEYDQNKKQFLSKDTAMYIVLALSAKKSTAAKGITETNPYVDVNSFFTTQVIPELLSGVDGASVSHPLILADCLKFVSIFRAQLPATFYAQLVPLLTNYLARDHMVLHTYASYGIERLLSVKDGAVLRFDKEALRPHLQPLLQGLFAVLDKDDSKENEYVMKALMRVCSVGQDAMVPFASVVISKITAILSYVSLNPKNPKFSHSMFETIAALIKYLCKSNPALVDSFESALFGPFQAMLSMESATDFSPYVFQLLAQLLELRADISPPYVSLFPAFLVPAIWSNQGNVPAVTRLLQAYLTKPGVWATLFANTQRFNGMLGVFQELLRLRSTEGFALDLLTSIVVDLDLAHTSKDLLTIFGGFLFPKLQPAAKPTPKLFKATVRVFLAFLSRHGLDTVAKLLDSIQPGIFGMLFDKIVLANVHFLSTEAERKLGAVVLTQLACTTPKFLADQAYLATWSRTILAAVKLASPKESKDASNAAQGSASAGVADDDDADDLLRQSDQGFSTAYVKLVFAAQTERDFVASVSVAPKDFFKQNVEALFTQYPGKFGGMLSSLPPADQQTLGSFFTANAITVR